MKGNPLSSQFMIYWHFVTCPLHLIQPCKILFGTASWHAKPSLTHNEPFVLSLHILTQKVYVTWLDNLLGFMKLVKAVGFRQDKNFGLLGKGCVPLLYLKLYHFLYTMPSVCQKVLTQKALRCFSIKTFVHVLHIYVDETQMAMTKSRYLTSWAELEMFKGIIRP